VLESSTEPCPQCGGTGHVRSVSSVALQLLRGLEEVLMKGATHNLVVRTRTEVALYVLNHKRGHLRDLENSFKVTLSVIADPTVSGQQSFVIDRGEQVHTLEAAKALLAAQAAASPPSAPEEAYDEDEPFDAELESEIETDETEGLSEAGPAGEAAEGDAEHDVQGPRRRRRRRRRGRGGGDEREGGMARDENAGVQAEHVAGAPAEDNEAEEDESDEQAGFARAEQGGGGERRPRRRGRRGGRRRRGGGMDDGLSGSVGDELAPPAAPEAEGAVADLDGFSATPSLAEVQPEPIAPAVEPQLADQRSPEAVNPTPEAALHESEKAAPRRSTVREKVSFLRDSQPDATPVEVSPPDHSPPADTNQPAPEPAGEPAPRRAGWWSRRFTGGQ
jgi:ribonuclease E